MKLSSKHLQSYLFRSLYIQKWNKLWCFYGSSSMFYLIPISSVIYWKVFSCFSVYSHFNIWELLSSPSLISKWSLGQSKMRPDWHTGHEEKGRDYGGRRANAGTAAWLRAPSLFDLESVTCARFWQIWKKLPFPDRGLTPGGLKPSECISEQRCDFAQVEQKGRDGN